SGVLGAAYLLRAWALTMPEAGLLSPWHYLLTQIRVLVYYIRLIFVPVGLNLDHDFRPSVSILEPSVLACLAILVFVAGAAVYWRRAYPVFAFSVFWFFITLAPTSSVIPIS